MILTRKEAARLNPLVGNLPQDTSDKIGAVLAFVQAQCDGEITLNKQAAAGLYYVCDFIQKAKRYESRRDD